MRPAVSVFAGYLLNAVINGIDIAATTPMIAITIPIMDKPPVNFQNDFWYPTASSMPGISALSRSFFKADEYLKR